MHISECKRYEGRCRLFAADYVNDVLNDNWQDLVRDVGPTIGDAFGEVIKTVLGGMFDNVPMQLAFPGHPSS